MIRKMTFISILAALGLSAAPASALFEQTVISPRSRAMGETSVAVSDVAFAAFSNPGQLGLVDRREVAATYVQPFRLDFTDFFYVGGALPIDAKYGNVGVGISHFKVSFNDTSLLKETQISVAHGFNLYSDIHSRVDFGYSLNLYSMEFGETISGLDPGSEVAVGVDVGMVVTVHKRTHIGFKIKNLNNPIIGLDEEELRRRLVGGAAYEPYEGVVTTFEIDSEIGEDVRYRSGAEMLLTENFALRAGITTGPNRLTGGFGYTYQDVGVNYGFSTGGGTLEDTHHFGLHFGWGGEEQ